ncbi:response regulator [Aquimarina longa]|uniref:response regulator n=1 Tax=Aquimarina longa TaxID=1080221 RepID=UPI000784A918|nr:hybrid sensor histidine kinase/response regulator [Aquimarina longa]
MHLHYFIAFFFFFIGNSYSFQQKKEFLEKNQIETTLDSIEYWIENDYLKNAMEIIDSTERIVLDSNNDKYIARIYRLKSALSLYLSEIDEFKSYLDKASDWQKKVNDQYGAIFINNLKGIYHVAIENDLDQAIIYYTKAIDLGKNIKDEQKMIDIYYNLSSSYYTKKDWESCYTTSLKGIYLAKKYQKNSRLMRLYYFCGMSSANLKEYDTAIEILERASKIPTIKNGPTKISYTPISPIYLEGLARVYGQKNQHEISNSYYRKYTSILSKTYKDFLDKYTNSLKYYKDVQIKESENEKIRIENEYQKKQLILNNYLILAGTAIILALIFVVFLQYNNSKLKTENNNLLKQKNDELFNAKKEIEDAYNQKILFINNITHELRTPLHAVTGISHLLNSEKSTPEEQKKQIKMLQFSGRYLLRYINDIIEMNTSGSYNEAILKKGDFNLTSLINDIKESIDFFIIEKNNNTFRFSANDNLPQNLIGDPECLSRIIISLMSGVSDYLNNEEIWFSVKNLGIENSKNKVLFSLKNKKTQFSDKKLNELRYLLKEKDPSIIFKAISDKNSNTSLKFLVTNKLLYKYHSHLRINSKEKGMVFDFEIAFDVEPNKNIEVYEKEETDKSNIRILIVEDDKVNQLIVYKIITGFGYACEIASDGYEAIKKNKKNQYDLIFMDIMMDGIDGFETTRRIRKLGIKSPIIALTAISESENKHFFNEVGILRIVNKPFEPKMLLKEIENSLV